MRGKNMNIRKTLSTILIIAGFSFSACSNKPEAVSDKPLPAKLENVEPSTATVSNKSEYTCEECVALVDKIVRSSDYDIYFKKNYKMGYSVLVNEATKEKVTIQIVIENNVPMGWLELQINEGILNDITNDPEEPKNVHGDIKMTSDFRKNCLQCCLD